MNIFTAVVKGITISVKKIGIAFKAVLTGMKILTVKVITFLANAIKTIIDTFVSLCQAFMEANSQRNHLAFQGVFIGGDRLCTSGTKNCWSTNQVALGLCNILNLVCYL